MKYNIIVFDLIEWNQSRSNRLDGIKCRHRSDRHLLLLFLLLCSLVEKCHHLLLLLLPLLPCQIRRHPSPTVPEGSLQSYYLRPRHPVHHQLPTDVCREV